MKQDLSAGITDPAVLAVVMSRLDEILRDEPPRWDDGNSWTDYVGKAKVPSAEELARFHAQLACDDTEGSIATSMAARAAASESEQFGKACAKAFAAALLDETCKGGKALTRGDEGRAQKIWSKRQSERERRGVRSIYFGSDTSVIDPMTPSIR